MQSQNIRRQFLKYFKDRQHTVVPSSSVVPHDDPTLLFINAGMNQFKDVFLGKAHRDYVRAASSQKCIRVGGKHNDLENVGHTKRHLTLFEMLGNFSFGDYFKSDAIKFAWEVSTDVFGFDEKKIWPSVFREDDEAFEIWTKYVPADRITRMDEKDNFWAMGETGPCGPCSELYYDYNPSRSEYKNPKQDEDGHRFLEFWNLVFMQYNLQVDGQKLVLPKPSIDTGAGLERVVSLSMQVDSVFATDILRGLIAQTENLSRVVYDAKDVKTAPAFHVIADHLRCLAFAIADGAQPSNVDRGYVLRKVLRRAVRYGRTLGFNEPFLAKILPRLVDTMGEDYPELVKAQHRIAEIITTEEESFISTLKRGGNILNQVIDSSKQHGNTITGDDAFKLKDTYGLPIDEIILLAKDAALNVDLNRYKTLEEEAKQRSRSVHKTVHQVASENQFADFVKEHGTTKFLGYSELSAEGNVVALVVDGAFVQEIRPGQEALVILDKSPFYAEMGGQIGDTGKLSKDSVLFTVMDTLAPYKGLVAHQGELKNGTLKVGDTVTASVETERRQKIANNHTATHLLHWALHQLLGEHVKQAGSVVDSERLRFDFNHHKALTKEEVQGIEDLVNTKIRENLPVKWYEIDYEEAQKRSEIKQFFGEKYSNRVRVVDIDYSKELCGGTHTSYVGTIGLFRIAKESSIAAGVRRIEAVTGAHAEAISREHETLLESVAGLLKSQPAKLKERVEKLLEEIKHMTLEIKAVKKKEVQEIIQRLSKEAVTIKNFKAIVAEVNLSPDELKLCMEDLFAHVQPSGVVILGTAAGEDKCHLVARVSDDLTTQGVQANKIIQTIAPIVEGTGGGKPNNAQAGGKNPSKLKEALAKATELLKSA